MWKVLDKATNTNKEVTKSGNSMPLDKNGDYLATCFARDPQGIKRITLDVQGYLICSKLMSGGAISQKKGPFYSDSGTQNLAPDANNKVLTEIFIMRGVNSSALNGNDCGGGYEAVYTKAYIMKCTGENYLDLTTTSELTLDFE